jgi:putrescine aminotransferase
VRQVCDRHGVLLIADEVVTGFGRGGAMFGTRLWNVKADLWCLAKGISSGYVPLGATAIGRQGGRGLRRRHHRQRGGVARLHLQRPSGGRGRALATLDVLEQQDVPGNAARVGAHLQARLRDLRRVSACRRRARPGPDVRHRDGQRQGQAHADARAAATCPAAWPRGLPRGAMVRMSGPT